MSTETSVTYVTPDQALEFLLDKIYKAPCGIQEAKVIKVFYAEIARWLITCLIPKEEKCAECPLFSSLDINSPVRVMPPEQGLRQLTIEELLSLPRFT